MAFYSMEIIENFFSLFLVAQSSDVKKEVYEENRRNILRYQVSYQSNANWLVFVFNEKLCMAGSSDCP